MNWKKTFAVVRREYVERVRTKAFWIATLLIPILFLAYIGIQISISKKTGGERQLVVVDMTGKLYQPLAKELADTEAKQRKEGSSSKGPHWSLTERPFNGNLDATKEDLRKEVLAKKINGYLILEPAKLEKEEVEYYSTTVSDFIALSQLQSAIGRIWMRQKMAARGLPADLAKELETRIDLKPFKVTEKGTAEEKGAGIIAALILLVLMYSTFFMYGYQVMRGTIEEKSNRIVEIIVASVRPTELMAGKILGIGLVGLTQYFVWSLVAMNLSLPVFAGILTSSDMGMPRIPISLLGYFMLFFLLGYFLYASVYTMISAPFNTDQEAQQLAMIPMTLILGGLAVYPGVMNNPSGGMALFFSLFPFTASLIMFLRTAVSEPPVWQILLSVAIMITTTAGLAWFAGRIYRVGILMYGKKPTIPEILRWARYSPGKAPQPAVKQAS
ncbi:MAG TPA: ABC transporter permease [Thermoanaerobaculia bacterium]|nr:ABC transporter permease [Thermoanaerobaculia bacterium]